MRKSKTYHAANIIPFPPAAGYLRPKYWSLNSRRSRLRDPLLRRACEGSISCDVTHGRVVMAVRCKTFQNSKYLFVLKQAMSALVVDSGAELYSTTE